MAGEFLGYEFEVPFAPAAGAINGHNLEVIRAHTLDVLRSPTAAAWIGTTPPRYNEGNPGRAFYHDPVTGLTLNAMKFPSEGLPAVLELVPELTQQAEDYGKPIVWNIATLEEDDPVEVLPVMAEQLFETGAQGVEINLSCPSFGQNIIGYNIELVYAIREAVRAQVGLNQNILEKWPVFINGKDPLIVPMCENLAGIRGVTVSNSVPITGRHLVEGGPVIDAASNTGGKSGRYMRGIAHLSLMAAAQRLPDGVALITANGVDSGAEVYVRTAGHTSLMGNRAVLATAVTAYMYGEEIGASYGQTATRFAEEYAEALEGAA